MWFRKFVDRDGNATTIFVNGEEKNETFSISDLSDGRDHAEKLLFLRAVNYRKVFDLKVKNRLM